MSVLQRNRDPNPDALEVRFNADTNTLQQYQPSEILITHSGIQV